MTKLENDSLLEGNNFLLQYFQWSSSDELSAVHVEFDPISGRNVVFLCDIQEFYRGEFCIKSGPIIIPYLKDSRQKVLLPKRIEFRPNIVLQVVPVRDPHSVFSPSNSTLTLTSQTSQLSVTTDTTAVVRSGHEAVQLLAEVANTMEEVRDNIQKNHAQVVDMLKTTQNWLALLLDRANAIFRLTYEMHEYPIPRLFVILPGRNSLKDQLNPLVDKYRLYFLCECDMAPTGESRKSRPHIHFAKHDGYDLHRSTEFFRKYGPYILTMLQLLRYSVSAASFAVPHIAGIGKGLEKNLDRLGDAAREQLKEKVDQAIGFLKALPPIEQAQDGVDVDNQQDTDIEKIEALEGADLRQLASFLKNRDDSRVLGNLYRLARPDGTIKWVCLDHYREEYKMIDQKHFAEFVAINNGAYHANEGKVEIRLNSRQMATQFYQQLSRARFVHELEVALDWHTTVDDFKDLRAVMETLPTILILKVDCCNTQSRLRDIMVRGTPSSVLAKLMAGLGIQALAIKNCTDFLSQFEKSASANQLRWIELGSGIEGLSRTDLISALVQKSPRLRHLVIQMPDLPTASILFKNANSYRFKGDSLLEVRLDSGDSIKGTIRQENFTEISVTALDSNADFSVLPFVTKLLTTIKSYASISLVALHFSKYRLRDVDITIDVARFYDLRQLLILHSPWTMSIYFHDRRNALRMSNILHPSTAEVDLWDDSRDFERLFSVFGAIPRYLGVDTVVTNDMLVTLEKCTQIESHLLGLWVDVAILDYAGMEHLMTVIQRSDLQELHIRFSTISDFDEGTLQDGTPTSGYRKLILSALPTFPGTNLSLQCPMDHIPAIYTAIRNGVATDMTFKLTLVDSHDSVVLDNVKDGRSAKVLVDSDEIRDKLEEFFVTFGSLPTVSTI
ncbi:hypothetical protein BGZ83_007192 [Gryganskiella cystojenkinii]|nr:hypothetical protein BGZ83_007192 [Gryganskiella cystojenkinii]